MNYVVQICPGASREDGSRRLGSLSPGRLGGRFRLKKLETFLWIFGDGDGGGSRGGAEFHDRDVAVKPEF